MPGDRKLRNNQTIKQRAEEIRAAVSALDKALQAKRVKVTVGPQGAIAFTGWTDGQRNGVTDACAYRRIMATGSALAKAALARAAQMAGRSINRAVVAAGHHSHDGGTTWHDHKG